MQPNVLLISQPIVDFVRFLDASRKVLGKSPASATDASRRILSDTERYLSCLAALRDPQAPVGISPHLMPHASFGVLVLADDRDLLDILACAAGMPFVVADTLARGVQIAVITGTLAQWRDAVISGSSAQVEATVRICFNKILALFESIGVNVWADCHRRQAPDRTLLLEDKRGR